MRATASLSERGPSAPRAFDPAVWLDALTEIGGGYALAAGGRLWLIVHGCQADDLAPVMKQIAGRPDRQASLRDAIERRQFGRTA